MIGHYILSSRPKAIACTTFSALLSLLFPPFTYIINGPVIALITLRKGAHEAFLIMCAGTFLLALLSFFAGLSLRFSFAYFFLVLIPIFLSSMVLRVTAQQGFLVAAIVLMATLVVIATYFLTGDASLFWQKWLDLVLEKAASANQAIIIQNQDKLEEAIPLFNGIMMVWLASNILMSVLLARWWQAALFNKGGFQKEFYAFQLPPVTLIAGLIVLVLAFSTGEPWRYMFKDILFLLMFAYFMQGISAVHRYIASHRLSRFWLIPIYFLLILPQTSFFIACFGIADACMRWRRKQ